MHLRRKRRNNLIQRDFTRAIDVVFHNEDLVVSLADGRTIHVPLTWFPLLQNASNKSRENWRFIGDGQGIHWPDIDEDIQITTLMRLE